MYLIASDLGKHLDEVHFCNRYVYSPHRLYHDSGDSEVLH